MINYRELKAQKLNTYCHSKSRPCNVKIFYSVCVIAAGPFLLSVPFLWLFGLAVALQDMLVQQSIIWKENNSVTKRSTLGAQDS